MFIEFRRWAFPTGSSLVNLFWIERSFQSVNNEFPAEAPAPVDGLTALPVILTASSDILFPLSMSNSAFALPNLRRRTILPRIWVPVFMMVGISLLSGTAGVQMGPLSFVGIDKIGHFVVFGLLGIAWCRFFRPEMPALRRLLLATFLTTLFGLMDELHQFHNPERYFEWADLLADAVGAFVLSASYLYVRPWQTFLELDFRRFLHLLFRIKPTKCAQ
jgi:hypothetical protein